MTSKTTAFGIVRQLLTPLFVISLFASVAPAQVVIDEVLYRTDPTNSDPLRSQQWVELFNKGAAAVDLTGWKITGRAGVNGPTARALPLTALAPGGYLVLHITSGTNSGSDYYTQDTAPLWNSNMDEVGLYSPQGIVDFISWGTSQVPYSPGTAHNDAVSAGIWTPNAALQSDGIVDLEYERPRPVDPGSSIGRDPVSTDTDTTADFEPRGGVGALNNSPGAPNRNAITVSDVAPPAAAGGAGAAPANKKWTVLLYFNGDNSLEKYIYGNVKEIDASGGSDANVNYVLMYDGKLLTQGTQRGLILSSPAGTPLSTFTLQHAPGDPSVQIGERDMGDPNELANFITWAKANYPADHYALILSAHGDSWKSWGPDETSHGKYDNDYLFIGEVQSAMKQQTFDLIGFDACMMAGIEVLDQWQTYASYIVASEEKIPGQGFPYDTFTAALKANSAWTGLDLGKNIVSLYAARYANYSHWTLSLIDTSYVTTLAAQIESWAVLLKTGAGLYQTKDALADNVQILLRNDRLLSTQFGTQKNYVDLYDLATHIQNDGNNPQCIKTPIPQLLNLISKAVVSEVHSADFTAAAADYTGTVSQPHGIHIYFPAFRSSSPEQYSDYDKPRSRLTDGSSHRAIYAANHDQLPQKARDREDSSQLDPRTQWPEPINAFPAQMNFTYFDAPHWSQFLERYYHPVADNHILYAVSPYGVLYNPTSSGGGACSNATDSISVPLNSTIFFSGAGSSDADQVDFQIPTAPGSTVAASNFSPSFDFWDLDSTVGCQNDPYLKGNDCTQEPMTVPPGAPADTAITNMDADRDSTDTTFDQKDASGPAVSLICTKVGTFAVTLMTWDDNHLKPFHNTTPTAQYVHPQTDSNQATVTCGIVTDTFYTTGTGYPSTLTVPVSFTVASDPFSSASYVGLTTGNLTMTFSGLGTPAPATGANAHDAGFLATTTPTVSITGDRPELVPATGTFNTANNSFTITGTSTGQIAGFPNVQARYTLSLGANLNTVTGTYQVGLNSTLNNEPSPVTYNVNGTVGSKTYPPPAGPIVSAVNTSGGGPVIAQNDWIEIHGINIVPATTPAAGVIWSSAPSFATGQLPTQLNGISVTVNGKPAFIYFYCSSVTDKSCATDQVNVLTPLDNTVGSVQVVVTSGSVSAPPFTVTMKASAPAFLKISPLGYVTATHADNSLIGPATLFPGYTTPAAPGESIVLYGVGFGLPSTPLVNGSSSQSGLLSPTPVCTVGSDPAQVVFAGLIQPGLYQLNLNLPAGAASSEVSCTYNGAPSVAGELITVQP